MKNLIRLLPLLTLAFAPACKKPVYPACKKDKHCKAEAGEKCVNNSCQNCQDDSQCVGKAPDGTDWVCFEFRCTDPAVAAAGGEGGAGEGAPCAQRLDCEGGLACKVGACASCEEDLDCAPNSCNLSTGRCDPAGQCTTDDECPMDEICDGGMCIFSGYTDEPGGGPCGVDSVFFAYDSEKLTPKAEESLTNLATCIAEQGQSVILEAHADATGTEEYNINLTERRGRNVMDFLSNAGAPGDLLQVIAKGSLEATGSNETERAKERRVQFFFQ